MVQTQAPPLRAEHPYRARLGETVHRAYDGTVRRPASCNRQPGTGVRSHNSWYRHTTVACLAHAYLSVTSAATTGEGVPDLRDVLPELSLPDVHRPKLSLVQNPGTTLSRSCADHADAV